MKSNKIQHPNTTNTLKLPFNVTMYEKWCCLNRLCPEYCECTGSTVKLLQELKKKHIKENLIFWITKYFLHTVWQKIHLEAEALKVTAACRPLRHDNISQNREGQLKQNRTSMKQPLTFRHTSFYFTTLQATSVNPLSYTESRPQTSSSDTQRWEQT